MDQECECSSDRKYRPTILFNILSGMDVGGTTGSRQDHLLGYGAAVPAAPRRCSCEEQRRTVCLQDPSEICRDATAILVKTVRFMKNLPAFNQMPRADQFSLLRSCWAPLFILGLAQERLDFQVTDTPADSMLKKILLNRQNGPGQQGEQPTMAGVSKLKSCLRKFWSLDLSPKEFAYLKGTAIFNPGNSYSSSSSLCHCSSTFSCCCSSFSISPSFLSLMPHLFLHPLPRPLSPPLPLPLSFTSSSHHPPSASPLHPRSPPHSSPSPSSFPETYLQCVSMCV